MANNTARPGHNRRAGRGGASEGAFLFDPRLGTVTSEMARDRENTRPETILMA